MVQTQKETTETRNVLSLSSNTMSVNVMVLTSDSILNEIKSDIANTTGFEIKEGY